MLNLSWGNQREDILVYNIREIFDETSKCANVISEHGEILKKVIPKEVINSNSYIYDILSRPLVESNLIYCKRVDSTKYSKEFIHWFSEKIQEKNY